MNRYAIFFLTCINLYTNIALSNASKNIEKKEKHEALKQEILDRPGEAVAKTGEFADKFNFFLGVNSLSPLGYKNATLLKDLCHQYLKGYFNRFSCITKEAIKNILEKEVAFCIATFARVKSSYDYKQQTTRSLIDKFIGSGKPLYSKNIKREVGQKAYQKALDEISQSVPGSLSYLVNGPIKKEVFEKTRELCARRLLSPFKKDLEIF